MGFLFRAAPPRQTIEMIKVSIDLHPLGIESEKRALGSMRIWNDATGTRDVGNYQFEVIGANGRVLKHGCVKGFPRRTHRAEELMYLCLKQIYDK